MISRDVLRGLLEQAGLQKIRPTGNGFQALCPFHDNKRTPAWGIGLNGLWSCLNPKCARTGNLVTFLVEVAHMPYEEAVRYQPPEVPSVPVDQLKLPPYAQRHTFLVGEKEFLPDATLDPFKSCPTYMLGRGYAKEFLREHEIGYDPAAPWPDRSVQDAVTFPVRDHDTGRLLGLTRRAIADVYPQYSHEVDKKRTLYLLHKLGDGPVCITEGPCDALTLRQLSPVARDLGVLDIVWQAMGNAVATLGGYWSAAYAEILRLVDRPVVLALDNDEAGEAAREQAIESLLEHGVPCLYVMRYPDHRTDDNGVKDPGALGESHIDHLSCIPYWKRRAARRP